MADLPEVGLQAVFERVDEFKRRANEVKKAYYELTVAEADVEEGSRKFGQAWDDMLRLMSLGALNQVAGTMGQVGDRLLGLAKEATLTAARAEELDAVLANLAERNELGAAAAREQVQAIKDQGITTQVASGLVSQFIRSNLDLAKASQLARLAQDAAVISMEDSSQALQGLLHGVLTLQPELLRYRGIIVDFQSEYKKWADANDRTVLSLTSAEKQMIALDAALAQGAQIAGTYESAMETASKQIRSFNRYIEELKEDFGEALLPVLTEGVFTAKDLVKQIQALPEPLKATIAATGALTGGILKGTSAMIGFASQAAQIAVALKVLNISLSTTSLAILGPVGLVAALTAVAGVGIASYLKEQEAAHQEEAVAIAASTTTYENYLLQVKAAELGSYALSEGLYEIAKAAEEAGEGLTTAELTQALRELESVFGGAATGIDWLDNFIAGINEGQFSVDFLTTTLERLLPAASAAQLAILQDVETLERWADIQGYSAEQTEIFIQVILDAVDAEELLRVAMDAAGVSMGDHEGRMLGLVKVVQDYDDSLSGLGGTIFDMEAATLEAADALNEMYWNIRQVDPAVEKLTASLGKLAEKEGVGAAMAQTLRALEAIADEAEADVLALQEDAREDREELEADHLKDMTKLWEDYQDRRGDIVGDIAEAEADLLENLADAEEEYQKDRLALVESYAMERAAAVSAYDQAQRDAYRDLLDDLADYDRQYQQDLVDARRDLARDLEDIDHDLVEREKTVWADYYAELESLAEDHGQRMADITKKYADERARIEERYRTEATAEELREEEREALLDQLAELRRLQAEGMTGIDYTQAINDVLAALDKMKQEELDALEEAQAAELAAEEAAYQERLALAEQRREEELQAEIDAAEKKRAERQRSYEQELEDLKISLDRQKAERERRYGETLVELQQQHQVELAEIDRANTERLAQLDARLAEEQARLIEANEEAKERLGEQLAAEKDSYDERKREMEDAYADQLEIINTKLGEQVEAVETKALEAGDKYIKAWESLDPAMGVALSKLWNEGMAPEFDEIAMGAYEKGLEAGRAYADGFLAGADIQSPPPWAISAGEDIRAGLTAGFGDMRSLAADAGASIQQTVQAAIPAQNAAAPSQTTVSNQRTYQLDYTGAPQSEASIRSLLTLMEMDTGG